MTESPVNQPGPYPGGNQPAPQYSGYAPPPAVPRNGLGTASLVIGIFALLSSPTIGGGVILGILAIILGVVGRGRVKRGEANNGGVAISGVVLGVLGLIAGLASLAIIVFVFKWVGVGDYVSCLNKAGDDTVKQQQCEDQFNQHVDQKFSVTLTPTPAP